MQIWDNKQLRLSKWDAAPPSVSPSPFSAPPPHRRQQDCVLSIKKKKKTSHNLDAKCNNNNNNELLVVLRASLDRCDLVLEMMEMTTITRTSLSRSHDLSSARSEAEQEVKGCSDAVSE